MDHLAYCRGIDLPGEALTASGNLRLQRQNMPD